MALPVKQQKKNPSSPREPVQREVSNAFVFQPLSCHPYNFLRSVPSSARRRSLFLGKLHSGWSLNCETILPHVIGNLTWKLQQKISLATAWSCSQVALINPLQQYIPWRITRWKKHGKTCRSDVELCWGQNDAGLIVKVFCSPEPQRIFSRATQL